MVKVYSKTLVDYGFSFPIIRKEILELPGNKPPTIRSLTANPSGGTVNKTSIITVATSDPENDPLTCSWTATGGSLSSTTGCGSVTWTAPGTPGTYSVSVGVTDNKLSHSPVSGSVTIAVSPNLPPTITSLIAYPSSITVNKPSTVTVFASDPENDSLTCAWSAMNGGALSPTTGCGPVVWTAPGTPGTYTISVSVTDNQPGHSLVTRTVDIVVSPNQPPTITSLTTPPSVTAGSTATIQVAASDPENDLLTCAWSSPNGGTLSSTTGCPSVSWTAPAFPGMYSVSVSVTDNQTGHSPVSALANILVYALNQPPEPPTGLSATDGTHTGWVGLTWTAPTTGGAPKGYKIYRYASNNPSAASQIGTTVGTSYNDYVVGDYNTYWYWVKAYNDVGTGPYSNGDSGYPTPFTATGGQVAVGLHHAIGLKSDGTVVAAGDVCGCGINDIYCSGCSLAFTNIVQIAAGDNHDVFLRSDGTVGARGDNSYGQCNVSSWTNIVQVAAAGLHTVGLKSDGTVVAVGYDNYGLVSGVGSWTNIAKVATGSFHTVGLKSNGTVVAVGYNNNGQLNVGSWTNIVQAAAGYNHTVGLKSNGTVVAVGYNNYGQLNVGSWTNIVHVTAAEYNTVGVKSDGAVVGVGRDNFNVLDGSWTNIVQVAMSSTELIGMELDGKAVIQGQIAYGLGAVFNWRLR